MKTKTELKYFDITQYEKEAEYLSEMHKSGWKFVGVKFPGIYSFEECTPENMIYQLDYNKNGIANKGEYVQMFQDCGWEYLLDFVGYSYFRKPEAEMEGGIEEIFCDDQSRVEMMDRVFKGRMIPMIVIFFLVILPFFYSAINLDAAGAPVPSGLIILYVLLTILYLCVFAKFGISYYNYKKNSGK